MHLENKMITVPTKQGLSENLGGGGGQILKKITRKVGRDK